MAYSIAGLARERFEPLFALGDDELAARNARRLRSEARGAPCRISLEEAEAGESLLLLNHVSHDVPTPFRTVYAIYVREAAGEPPCYSDKVPPSLDTRTLGLRGFDASGMSKGVLLAMRARRMRGSGSCSGGRKLRAYTRTVRPMAASWRGWRGTDHGERCETQPSCRT